MNSLIGIPSLYRTIQPPDNPSRLPAVVVRPQLPAVIAPNPNSHSPGRSLKRLTLGVYEAAPPEVHDVAMASSFLEFPLGYLRGVLLAAYQWAEKFLSPERSPEATIDLYI